METVNAVLAALGNHLDTIVMVLTAILAYTGYDSKVKTAAREYKIREKAEFVYYQVEKIARKTPMVYDDVLAVALGLFVKALDLAGIKADDKEVEVAKMVWTQLHEKHTKEGTDAASLYEKTQKESKGEARPESAV